MILPCISLPNAVYANMKARKLGVAARLNGRTASRSVRPFWPVINNAGIWPDPAGGRNRTAGLANEKERTCVNMRANSRSRHALNADRTECRLPKMAACRRNAAWSAYG